MDAPTVTIGRFPATLVPPSPLFAVAISKTREEIDALGEPGLWAHFAASLAACWPRDVTWPAPVPPRRWSPRVPVADYGHEIFDGLVQAGLSPVSIIKAGREAHNFAVGTVNVEVSAAVGLSEAPSGG